MSGLSERWLEAGEDFPDDTDELQHLRRRHKSFAESYSEGRGFLYVQARFGHEGIGIHAVDYCAVYANAVPAEVDHIEASRRGVGRNAVDAQHEPVWARLLIGHADRMAVEVLVELDKAVETEERMLGRVRSFVWLQTLDLCLPAGMNALDLPPIEVLFACVDRKGVVPGGFASVSRDELLHEMVECGADLAHRLPDFEGPLGVWLLSKGRAQDVQACFRVALLGDSTRVCCEPPGDLPLSALQFSRGAFELAKDVG